MCFCAGDNMSLIKKKRKKEEGKRRKRKIKKKNQCNWICATVLVKTWVWLRVCRLDKPHFLQRLCISFLFRDHHIFFIFFSVNFRRCEAAGRHKISLESATKPNKVHFNTWRVYSRWEKCSNFFSPYNLVNNSQKKFLVFFLILIKLSNSWKSD